MSDETEQAGETPASTDGSGSGDSGRLFSGMLGRRKAMTGLAVGGAVAWTVPQIISVQAASAATCLGNSVQWIDFADTVADYPNAYPFDVPIDNNFTVSVSFSTAGIGGGTAAPTYATSGVNPLGGQPDNYIVVEMSATAPGEFCEITFDFGTPVKSLQFNLLDIDLGQGFWQDEVIVSGSLAAVPVTPLAFVHGTDISDEGAGDFRATTDPSGTGAGTDNNATTANIALAYSSNQAIDQLVIRYIAGPDETTPNPQQIGISAFSYCI